MKTATLKQVGKILELLEGIPAEHVQELLESGLLSDLLKANVNEMSRKEFRKLCGLMSLSYEFPVWKIIKIGTGLCRAQGFYDALESKGLKVSVAAGKIMSALDIVTVAKEEAIELILVSVAELGFGKEAQCCKIYDRAREFGLGLCSPEVAFQLRYQYTGQPVDESLFIAMEPIDSDDGLCVFSVGRTLDRLWLSVEYCDLNNFWSTDTKCIFVRFRR